MNPTVKYALSLISARGIKSITPGTVRSVAKKLAGRDWDTMPDVDRLDLTDALLELRRGLDTVCEVVPAGDTKKGLRDALTSEAGTAFKEQHVKTLPALSPARPRGASRYTGLTPEATACRAMRDSVSGGAA